MPHGVFIFPKKWTLEKSGGNGNGLPAQLLQCPKVRKDGLSGGAVLVVWQAELQCRFLHNF